MQVNPIRLNELKEVVGKVEAVSVVNGRVKIVLSITPMLLDVPLSKAKFSLPKTEMNIGILRSDRSYLLRNLDDRRPRAPILANDYRNIAELNVEEQSSQVHGFGVRDISPLLVFRQNLDMNVRDSNPSWD